MSEYTRFVTDDFRPAITSSSPLILGSHASGGLFRRPSLDHRIVALLGRVALCRKQGSILCTAKNVVVPCAGGKAKTTLLVTRRYFHSSAVSRLYNVVFPRFSPLPHDPGSWQSIRPQLINTAWLTLGFNITTINSACGTPSLALTKVLGLWGSANLAMPSAHVP